MLEHRGRTCHIPLLVHAGTFLPLGELNRENWGGGGQNGTLIHQRCTWQREENVKYELALPVNGFSYLWARAGLSVFPGHGE